MNVFHHTGDLGDIIACFPVIRELGGGKLVISDAKFPLGHGPRETLRGNRFKVLQPIVEAAPYISEIMWEDKPTVTHDIASFRSIRWYPGETLTQWQGRYFDLKLPAAPEPWLKIESSKRHGKIVVGRTARYHTSFFPWRLIVDQYHENLLFVGTVAEYIAFVSNTDKTIDFYRTENLLEAAEVIAGSRMFIGGQSVLFWLAAGLGHPLIQETHEVYTRNSIVPRDNAIYSDSNENLEKIYDKLQFDKVWLKRYPVPVTKVNLSTSAQEIQTNLSTSAEVFNLINTQKEEEEKLIEIQQGFPSPSFS